MGGVGVVVPSDLLLQSGGLRGVELNAQTHGERGLSWGRKHNGQESVDRLRGQSNVGRFHHRESKMRNRSPGNLHFNCFPMDFVNSSQCCMAEKRRKKRKSNKGN